MAEIVVVHEDPMKRGGGEAVFVHTLAALEPDHDLTVYTTNEWDLETLTEYFGVTVGSIRKAQPRIAGVPWKYVDEAIGRLTSGRFAILDARRLDLFHGAVRRCEPEADLVVYTQSESAIGSPSIQYVHHPKFRRVPSEAVDTPDSAILDRLEGIVSPISNPGDFPPDAELLTNSEWTADDVESVYSVRPDVVYPPVNTSDLPSNAETNSVDSVVMVGRVAPYKRQHVAISILEGVRQRGHDLGLTIVGPPSDEGYASEVAQAVAERDWATYRDGVSRSELADVLTTHRYGIHGHPREHFGIAVAEMVAAGCLPVVPDDGGQVEIVGGIADLCWSSPEQAIERLSALCASEAKRRAVRSKLPDIEERFGPERFRTAIVERVARCLDAREGDRR